jgi:hypothetical protein
MPLKRFIMNKNKAVSTIVADSESGGFTARPANNFNESMELSHLNLTQIKRDLRHRKNRLSK